MQVEHIIAFSYQHKSFALATKICGLKIQRERIVACCVCMATVVTRTCRDVTLDGHCLSYYVVISEP
jgi:hypothetical protein